MAQRLKRLPGMRETRVQSLGWEDPLEKEMATHSSTLAWRIPWREATVHGVTKSQIRLSNLKKKKKGGKDSRMDIEEKSASQRKKKKQMAFRTLC